MIGKFLTKTLLKSQMKNVPADQQEQIMTILEKDPKLFEKIAKEIKNRTEKGGEDEMKASIEVMKKYREELQKILT